MRVSSHKLAIALTERIGPVVPRPVTLVAADREISVYSDGIRVGGAAAANILDLRDRPLNKLLQTAVLSGLGDIQDMVIREIQAQWPVERDGTLALPGARVDDASVISFWYGKNERAAAVSFRPIELSEIVD